MIIKYLNEILLKKIHISYLNEIKKFDMKKIFFPQQILLLSLLQVIFFTIFLTLILITTSKFSFETSISDVPLNIQAQNTIAILFGYLLLIIVPAIALYSRKNLSKENF